MAAQYLLGFLFATQDLVAELFLLIPVEQGKRTDRSDIGIAAVLIGRVELRGLFRIVIVEEGGGFLFFSQFAQITTS
jgi:hypothetical protein